MIVYYLLSFGAATSFVCAAYFFVRTAFDAHVKENKTGTVPDMFTIFFPRNALTQAGERYRIRFWACFYITLFLVVSIYFYVTNFPELVVFEPY